MGQGYEICRARFKYDVKPGEMSSLDFLARLHNTERFVLRSLVRKGKREPACLPSGFLSTYCGGAFGGVRIRCKFNKGVREWDIHTLTLNTSQFGEVIGELIARDSNVSLHPGKPNQSLRQAKFIFYGNYKFRSRPVALEGLDGRPTNSVNADFLFIFNSPIHCLTQSRKLVWCGSVERGASSGAVLVI
ncbi:hypothetical protein AVEN_128145-1 [Araneus ventricosus]|uniref:Uncharacterized protein n=1 Tax=Araneus ventricosus TaxID=182803 RepID=A0A4Y1ZZP0_ARAVE|nr:hypothetical protein AVEN_128145-1 [Araneus ventricosus]